MRWRTKLSAGWLFGCMVCGLGVAGKAAQPTPAPPVEQTPKQSPSPLPTISEADLELLNKILFWVEAEPDMGEAPLKVKFTLDLEGEELKKPRFHWDFGDATTSKEREPVHVFKRPGEYKVSCRIDDVDGRWGRDEITIFVDPKEPPVPPTAPKKEPEGEKKGETQ